MSLGKTIVGGLVGAVVAVGAYWAIRQTTGESYVWFPLVTGALTGIGARLISGSPGSYASGAVAGLIALLGMVCIEFIPVVAPPDTTKTPAVSSRAMNQDRSAPDSKATTDERLINQGNASRAEAEAGRTGEETGDAADQGTEDQAADSAAATTESADSPAASAAQETQTPASSGDDQWTQLLIQLACSGIGILLAYQITRGFGPAAGKTAAKAPPKDDAE